MSNSSMKILTLDIETSPLLVYTWGLWNQNIGINQIVEPTRVISYAAKWLHEDEVYYLNWGDKDFIETIYELLDEADAVVTYNGIQFDNKHLNREFVEHGLTPPTPYFNIDLYSVVKRHFRFPSNKLDYVARELLGENKTSHTGFSLWWKCIHEDDAEAWKLMEEYNIQDVLLTESLYLHLRGWITNHPNHGLYVEDQHHLVCRNCGSTHVVMKGQEYTASGQFKYQRYKCMDCGANLRGRHNVKGSTKTSPQMTR